MPLALANFVRPATVRMFSLRMIRSRWVSTVRTPTPSRAAISLLLRPSAIKTRTSRSRSESSAALADRDWPFLPSASSSSNTRETAGLKKPSPAWISFIARINSAGEVSLSKSPRAPRRIMRAMYSRLSCIVRITILESGTRLRSRVTASKPVIFGMLMSMSTKSGRSSLALRSASCPSAASPTTSRSSWADNRDLIPSRTMGWSSTSRSLIFLGFPFFTAWAFRDWRGLQRNAHHNFGPFAPLGFKHAHAPDEPRPFLHVHQPHAGGLGVRRARVEAPTVILDRHGQQGTPPGDRQRDPLGPRMLFNIVERFLDDPIHV